MKSEDFPLNLPSCRPERTTSLRAKRSNPDLRFYELDLWIASLRSQRRGAPGRQPAGIPDEIS